MGDEWYNAEGFIMDDGLGMAGPGMDLGPEIASNLQISM